MKITKQRLQQIIQEEINSYKASYLNESIDVKTIQNLEAAIGAAYQEITTPTDVEQTYADTGEPVSKDPQDIHDKAVEFLVSVVKDVTSGETLDSPRTINEDGHTDIPSAARKMKLAIEDAGQILSALENGQGDLPSWWMSKVTIAADYLNKARDYLLVPSQEMEEKLKPSDGAGAYVDDFRKSDAPQFKGKSKKKKQQMAIAAYLDDKDKN
tara:strand:- start:3626 stop:4261 length:636 start_codon:yes stop_codon:yes gene_type:complete